MTYSRDIDEDQSAASLATARGILNVRLSDRRRVHLGRVLTGALLSATLIVSLINVAGAGSESGTATPVAGSQVAAQPSVDLQPIIFQPCDVTPRNYDELMTMIATVSQDPESYPAPPPWLTPSINPNPGPTGRYFLPDGPTPSPEMVQTLVQLLGTFESCTPLQRAALRPDDLLVRSVFEGDDGARVIADWWRDAHQPPEPPAVRDSRLATPTIYQLYGFRTFDATHVGAYVELSGGIRLGVNPAAGTYQPTWTREGYIVFTQGPDGRWLVDSFVSPLGDVVDTLFPEGGATPAP